eukprot:651303-Prymnesium_polylepis.1
MSSTRVTLSASDGVASCMKTPPSELPLAPLLSGAAILGASGAVREARGLCEVGCPMPGCATRGLSVSCAPLGIKARDAPAGSRGPARPKFEPFVAGSLASTGFASAASDVRQRCASCSIYYSWEEEREQNGSSILVLLRLNEMSRVATLVLFFADNTLFLFSHEGQQTSTRLITPAGSATTRSSLGRMPADSAPPPG